ncbi:MAG: RHS repeat domain-containing protein [Paludibacter sp.]
MVSIFSGQHKQTFTYDNLSRVINVKEEIDSKVFNQSTQYDALGRIRKETYPSGYFTVNHYDDHCGILAEVKDKYNRRLWKVNSENAKGQITQVQQGDKTTTLGYDNKGMPTSIQASGVVNMTYFFNNNGNLDYRIDSLTNQKEVFQYDGMNRLTHWNIYRNNALVKSDSMVYHTTKGTITSKSDLGNFTMTYGENGKPHALTSISGVPTGFPASDLNVTYTDFKKIKTLSEGNQQYILTYGIDDQRRKSEYKLNGATQKTKYYLGNYEEKILSDGNIQKIHYLSGGAIYILSSPPSGEPEGAVYYTYTDYLGSLIALTNESGTVVERYAYDPWGTRRNPTNWTQTDNRTIWIVNRGYTGHEHLDAFSIINMNGRVYDPLTAQFFSPDPFVQAPGNWLNFNRYAYAFGNPFKYTDPDGDTPLVFIAIALVGGGFNLISNFNKIDSFGIGLGYFLSGAGGAVISVFNPAAGGTFTMIGNTIMDVATGHLPDFTRPEQVLGYVGGKVLDGFGAAGIGQMGKQIAMANGWLTSIQTTGSFTKLGPSITSEAGIGGVEVTVTATKTSGNAAAGITGQAGKTITQTIAGKGTTVLGKYPQYINLADEIGANRFQVPTNVWNKMTPSEQWVANQKFLDRAILRGDDFILSNKVVNIESVTGAFRQELDYMLKCGYRISNNGSFLIKW